MLIIPAIDLYRGKVVRFLRGDPSHSKVYSDDPLAIARKWQDGGASILHVVDLSAALGEEDNLEVIAKIIKDTDIKIQVGGGIRDLAKAQDLISLGAERIVIGTKSLDDTFLKDLLNSLGPQKLAVGVDAVDSFVAIEGWQKKTKIKASDFIAHLEDKGIKWVIYTDISRDGTLKGPNIAALRQLGSFSGINFIASGGVSSLKDLEMIKNELPFIKGVIIGKALYENNFTLGEAVALEKEG
jgi:phosphoribosylformimino-5-aminoimidazole carboxamide ribotide isomerase